MENKDVNPPVTRIPSVNHGPWAMDKLGTDPFETQNLMYDIRVNGITKTQFDRRNAIDRKNLVDTFVGQYGMKWVGKLFDSDKVMAVLLFIKN